MRSPSISVVLVLAALSCAAVARAQEGAPEAPDVPEVPDDAVEGEIVEVDGRLYEVRDGALVVVEEQERERPTEIQVTGSRVDRGPTSAVSADEVGVDVIKETGARTLADVLERVPGAVVTSSLGTGQEVSLDGLDPKHVLILIDGRPVNGRVNDRVDVSRLPISPGEVERVEIVRGPMSALYGSDALGGVVNIITKRPQEGVHADVEAGARTAANGLLSSSLAAGGSASFGPFVLRSHGALLLENGFDRAARDDESGAVTLRPDGQLDRPHRRQGTLTAEVGLFLFDWLVRLEGGLSFNDIETRVSNAVPFRDHAADAQGRAALAVEGDVVPGHALDLDLSYDHFTHRFEKLPNGDRAVVKPFCRPSGDLLRFFDEECPAAANVRSDAAQDELRLDGNYTFTLFEKAPLVDAFRAAAGSTLRYEHAARKNGDGEDTLPGGELGRLSFALYGEALWKPWPFLSVVPGMRFDASMPGSGVAPFAGAIGPKLAARLDLPFGFFLRGSYGQGFRLPSFQERYLRFDHSDLGYIVEGNPELEPEKSQGARLGIGLAALEHVSVGAEGFLDLLEDLIAETPVRTDDATGVPVYRYQNISRAYVAGLNLSLDVVELWGASLSVGYQYLANAVDTSACPVEDPYFCTPGQGATSLPLRPAHKGNVALRYRLAATSTTLFTRADFMDERPIDSVRRAPGFVRMGAGLVQPLFDRVEATLLLDNLLDAYDPVFGPKPGRSIALTLRGAL